MMYQVIVTPPKIERRPLRTVTKVPGMLFKVKFERDLTTAYLVTNDAGSKILSP